MIKIQHKRSDCIGCMLCTRICPTYWHMDDEGMAALHTVVNENEKFQFGQGFPDDIEALKKAEKSCPVSIIRIEGR